MVQANPGSPYPTSLANPVSQLAYPAQGGMALLGFIRLFFFPVGLSLVHTVPVPEGFAMLLGYSIWPVSGALGIAAMRQTGKIRMVGIALLWFVIALAPSLVLVRLNTPLAEHRAAIAVIMPLIALSSSLYAISRETLRALVLVSLCVILGVASLVQALPWRTEVDLWTHEVKVQPENPRAWGFLADTLYDKGDYQGSRQAIMNALRLEPKHPIYLGRAAAIELATGNAPLAAMYLKQGFAVEQNLPMLHLIEAERLAISGKLAEAYVHAETVTRLAPSLSAGWNAKGNVLFMQGKMTDAVSAYRQALRFDPDNKEAAVNLRRALNLKK
jgi:tetratricopeptide (TPR) repeat protein